MTGQWRCADGNCHTRSAQDLFAPISVPLPSKVFWCLRWSENPRALWSLPRCIRCFLWGGECWQRLWCYSGAAIRCGYLCFASPRSGWHVALSAQHSCSHCSGCTLKDIDTRKESCLLLWRISLSGQWSKSSPENCGFLCCFLMDIFWICFFLQGNGPPKPPKIKKSLHEKSTQKPNTGIYNGSQKRGVLDFWSTYQKPTTLSCTHIHIYIYICML